MCIRDSYNGLGIRFEYTKEGLLHSITDSAGRRLRVEHDTRNGRIPVSYTHLDVYKRQLDNRWPKQ